MPLLYTITLKTLLTIYFLYYCPLHQSLSGLRTGPLLVLISLSYLVLMKLGWMKSHSDTIQWPRCYTCLGHGDIRAFLRPLLLLLCFWATHSWLEENSIINGWSQTSHVTIMLEPISGEETGSSLNAPAAEEQTTTQYHPVELATVICKGSPLSVLQQG